MPEQPRGSTRFRIDISPEDEGWNVAIYDLADHGPDLPYANVWSGQLERALREAGHYVLMATDDDRLRRIIDENREALDILERNGD